MSSLIESDVAEQNRPLVVALLYEGLCLFEFSCVTEIFGRDRRDLHPAWYRFALARADRSARHAQHGLALPAAPLPERLAGPVHTLIVPGWTSADTPVPALLARRVRALHASGTRIVSICSGVFVLAAAGLLDGRAATTHWMYTQALKRCYPQTQLAEHCLYVGGDGVWTSAGSAAGIDLCLQLVRGDFGPAIANQVARRLVMPPHRDGGQAQYVERPLDTLSADRFSKLLEAMQRNPEQAWSLARMAQHARTSERSLIRHFRSATGTSPGEWLTRLRVDQARALLEGTPLSVDVVAARAGLGNAITLRHHFRRLLQTTPSAFRNRFRLR